MLPLNPAQCTLGNEGLDEYQSASANAAIAAWLSLIVMRNMDDENLPDLKGKGVALYVANAPPFLQNGVVFEYASFVRQGGRLFVVGRAPEYSPYNAQWSSKLQGGIPWDAVLHYVVFDSHDDYVQRCPPAKASWRKRIFG
jgi:hypothetical protein